MAIIEPSPAFDINRVPPDTKPPRSYTDHLSAIDASISAMLDQLLVDPDRDAETQLSSYLLGHVLYLVGRARGMTQPVETMNLLAAILAQQVRQSISYEEYLRTEHWRVTRMAALDRAEHQCQLCSNTESLQVHHRTYERLWGERPSDLIALCRDCHARFHGVAS